MEKKPTSGFELSEAEKKVFGGCVPDQETKKLVNNLATGNYGMPGTPKKKWFLAKVEEVKTGKKREENYWWRKGKITKNNRVMDVDLGFSESYF